ncbi:hypothetical protein ACFSQJ_03765 [Croceitalea marina]|uniref:Tetratricopeptide repeat protein n=1 Tax=Croceitalea marina TaxID=1775166 RepID=A0ABW5MS40_9FLAO
MRKNILITVPLLFVLAYIGTAQVDPSTTIFKKAFSFDFKTVKSQYEASLNNGYEGDSLFYDLWYRGLKLEKNKHYIDATEKYEKALHVERSEVSSYEVKFSIGRLELLKGLPAKGTTFLYEFISEAQKEIDGENMMWSLTEKGKKQLNKKIELAEELLVFARDNKEIFEVNLPKQSAKKDNPFRKPAEKFLNRLRKGSELSSYFGDSWTLKYYKDDRCEGMTMGRLGDLTAHQIDSDIEITLNNDGYGWGNCERKGHSSYVYQFNLKQLVKDWNRYEITDGRQMELHIFYIMGGGESDYIKIYFNEQNLIVKLEYRSEDPG